MNKQLQNNILVPQVVACSTHITTSEEMEQRVELLIDGVTNSVGLSKDIVSQEQLNYPADEVNGITNPAFETLRKIYSTLNQSDRVEVLVYNDENRLKHAFVDEATGFDRRGYTLASKYDQSVERMQAQLDEFANQLNIPCLNGMERDISEIIYDDVIVRNIITG